jgi:hypothetical protein
VAGDEEAAICRRADGQLTTERPEITRRLQIEPLSRLNHTLAEHYQKKRGVHARDARNTYDRDLAPHLLQRSKHRRSPAASTILLENRVKISRMVSKWTGEYQPTLDTIFNDMVGRCRVLKLRAVGSERQLRIDFTVLLTATTVHSLFSPTRRQWFAL